MALRRPPSNRVTPGGGYVLAATRRVVAPLILSVVVLGALPATALLGSSLPAAMSAAALPGSSYLSIVSPTGAGPAGSNGRARAMRAVAALLAAAPRYQQMYISSCEAASVHIALGMMGVDVPERLLIAELPIDRRRPVYNRRGAVVRWGDPYQSFVGDITRGDSWPLVGYGVYAPPILALLRRNGMTGSYGGSHLTLDTLRRAIDAGHPVIVWVPKLTLYRDKQALARGYWTTWAGRRVPWNRIEHAQVLVGYDATGFFLDNPDYGRWSGGRWLWHYTKAQFRRGWDVLEDQAVVVAPAHVGRTVSAAVHAGAARGAAMYAKTAHGPSALRWNGARRHRRRSSMEVRLSHG